MNMLASLKTLLFSSALPGSAVTPAAGQEGTDFAAMLSGSMADAPPADAAVTPAVPLAEVASAPAIAQDFQMDAPELPQQPHDHVPPGLAVAVAAGKGTPASLPPGLALGLVRRTAEGEVQPEAQAEPGSAVAHPAPETQAEQPGKPVQIDRPAKPPHVRQRKEVAPEAAAPVADIESKPAEAQGEPATVQPKEIAAAVVPDPMFIAAPVIAAPPAPLPTVTEPVSREGDQSAAAIAPTVQPAAAIVPSAPLPVATSPAKVRQTAEATTKSAAKSAENLPKQDAPAVANSSPAALEQPVAPIVPKEGPVKSEALALLQLVREQVAGRQSGAQVRIGDHDAAAASAKEKPIKAPLEAAPGIAISGQAPEVGGSSPSVAPAPVNVQSTTLTAPAVDLSASLGAQMVDMGVSGQWIDGLARDIAGLSANGAQGRFQIDTQHLGAVQVDIRHGTDGAAVSLTVASEAAETALRQDSDRLKLDASLAAVRIAEVKVERATPVAEAHRAEMGGQSSSQQQQPQQGSQSASGWQQNGGQNMGQPQSQQNRWQGRENNGFGSKGSGDPAVLNHADAQQVADDRARARYA